MPETTTEPTALAEFPMCWYSPSLGFLVPDPMSDDGQGVMQVANGRVMLCLPDDAARLGAVDRLRAELAETRAAGDALAFAVAPIERMGRGAPGSRLDVLITRAEEWRPVRGDAPAPAEPPADPEPTRWSTLDDAMRVAHERPLISSCTWHSRSECVCPVHDVVGRLSDAGMLRDAAPAATPESPAVGLPVTLSSPDDVGAVCLAHGLTSFDASPWEEGGAWETAGILVEARDDQTWHITLDGEHGADLDYGYPAAALVAAIEAARDGAQ